MDEVHGAAEKGNATIGIGALGTILEVALDGTTYLGKLGERIATSGHMHYSFTKEELDFIINYDIKYRMGDELNEE